MLKIILISDHGNNVLLNIWKLLKRLQMKIISHRGNIEGPDASVENHPDQIKKVIEMGFDVEIDVRYIDGKYVLGHDTPDYQVSKDFLLNNKLWCHAKNIDGTFKHEYLQIFIVFGINNDDIDFNIDWDICGHIRVICN